jgi:predicted phosphoadenosine phosphosulfate sulfurtransferase
MALQWFGDQVAQNHTWKSYMEFYLKHSKQTSENYTEIETSQRFGGKKGGCLSSEVIS